MISRILQLLMVDIITVGRENASTADAIPTEVFSAAEPTPLPVPQSPQTKVRISHLR
jgi:hypothetical protein